jgi:hypothetical protein
MRLSKLVGALDLDLEDMMGSTGSFVDSIILEDSLALGYLNLI